MDLKQLPGLKQTKLVMYGITSKLSLTFGMIGNARANKMTAKVVHKNSNFRFSMKNYFAHADMQ